MTSSTGSDNSAKDKLKVHSSITHAGNLIEHISVSSAAQLSELITRCSREGRRVVPGRPVKLPRQPADRFDYFLTLDGADAVIEHCRPDQVITIEAGVSISTLQKLLAAYKQWFPVYVPDEDSSLMEYINTGSSGPLEHGYGEARDLVLGMDCVLGRGELIKCGGKVVKNVTGYDLPKLFCGASGTLCIPFSAHLRLFALPETSSTIVLRFANLEDAFKTARALRRSGLPLSCLEAFDAEVFAGRKLPFGSIAVGYNPSDTLLCVQIHGIKSVVAELEKEVLDIAAQLRTLKEGLKESQVLDATMEAELWKFLSRPYQFLESDWLEICGPMAALEKVLAELKAQNPSLFMWTARPGRNKAVLMHKSSGDTEPSVSKLLAGIAVSTQASEKFSVAYSDSGYLWNWRSIPAEDAVLSELKHRVKHEYDPQRVLNPLVSL